MNLMPQGDDRVGEALNTRINRFTLTNTRRYDRENRNNNNCKTSLHKSASKHEIRNRFDSASTVTQR